MVDWKARTLYDRIVDTWKADDDKYSRRNTNLETIIRCYRPDETPTTGEEQTTRHRDMEFLGQDIFNGGGPWYSRMMATGFQGSLVSKNISWLKYQMEQFELKGVDELDIWLQEIKEYMADAYTRSNFYDVQPQFTLDGLTIGSPVMFGEEDMTTGRTMWMPQYYRNVRMFYDKFNNPEGVIVKDKRWTAKQIFDAFIGGSLSDEKRKDRLTLAVNRSLDSGNLGDEYTVFRAVFKVSHPIWDGETPEAWQKPANFPWLSVYMLETQDSEKEKREMPLNDNVGYFSRPFVVWDFEKKPWEVSSRTPAWYAVWDCMGLNQVHKQFLENGQLKNRPPRYALTSMKNRLRLSPEGEMYVSDQEYDRPPKALDMIGDVQLSQEIIEIYDDALKRWFFIDRFAMFSSLAQAKNQPVSASQIWQMAGEKSTLLSPAIETHSKYLESVDARMVDLQAQAGRGPFSPDRMADITDIVLSNVQQPELLRAIGVQPVFVGPLAQAQKVSQALQPIQDTMAAVAPLIDIFPEIRHMYRPYDIADDMGEALDFPQKNIIPKEEWEEIVKAEREAAAQQQAQLMAIETAKALPSVSGAVDETSVLAGATT